VEVVGTAAAVAGEVDSHTAAAEGVEGTVKEDIAAAAAAEVVADTAVAEEKESHIAVAVEEVVDSYHKQVVHILLGVVVVDIVVAAVAVAGRSRVYRKHLDKPFFVC
jgi:hypothetical protein